jgi:hypothetical protein
MLKKKVTHKKDMGHLYKVTQSLRNAVMLVWATFVAYIIYVEFVRDIVTIL